MGPLEAVKFLYVAGPLSFLEKSPAQEVLVSFPFSSDYELLSSEFLILALFSVGEKKVLSLFSLLFSLFTILFSIVSSMFWFVLESGEEVCSLKSIFNESLNLLA